MKQVFNPILPLHEYIPDVEAHVFGDRVYLYGSHDKENGDTFCMLDYVIYSAPINDLTDWSNKGINYSASQDPLYSEKMNYMYAPDCVKGNDGRYYLYYCLSGYKGQGGYSNPVSVAVCDTPDGNFEFYGHVKDKDGSIYNDVLLFDPAVINDNGTIRLYCGSDLFWLNYIKPKFIRNIVLQKTLSKTKEEIKKLQMGSFHIELEDDMLTVKKEAVRIDNQISGAEYQNHKFFEGSSIRKINDLYYFVYSSINNHELCYATSKYPDKDFVYGGTIVSNGDIGYQGRSSKDRLNHTGTNHGCIECINDKWYVFYHRLTHNSDYSRQVCAEKININKDGSIDQVEITSCGLNNGYLKCSTYPAAICCNLTNGKMNHASNSNSKTNEPNITNNNDERYITGINNNTSIVYKYFELEGDLKLSLAVRGSKGRIEIYFNEQIIETIDKQEDSSWTVYSKDIKIEKGIYSLTFKYIGKGEIDFKEFTIEKGGSDNV